MTQCELWMETVDGVNIPMLSLFSEEGAEYALPLEDFLAFALLREEDAAGYDLVVGLADYMGSELGVLGLDA